MMTIQAKRPTWEATTDSKRFFRDVELPSGETETRMIRFVRACVVVSIPLKSGAVEKVAFMKSNRGKQYRDSRGKKVTSKGKGDFDGGETRIAPLMISETEVRAELHRLLDDSYEAEQAFRALQV